MYGWPLSRASRRAGPSTRCGHALLLEHCDSATETRAAIRRRPACRPPGVRQPEPMGSSRTSSASDSRSWPLKNRVWMALKQGVASRQSVHCAEQLELAPRHPLRARVAWRPSPIVRLAMSALAGAHHPCASAWRQARPCRCRRTRPHLPGCCSASHDMHHEAPDSLRLAVTPALQSGEVANLLLGLLRPPMQSARRLGRTRLRRQQGGDPCTD
jgi:hypothetical protein